MKKFYSRMAAVLTASFAVVCMCSAFPASAAETVRLTGDLDGDLHVTALDAQMTLDLYAQALVGIADNTATEENSNVDIDMDGEIDVLDAQYILLYYCQTLVGDQPLWADFREVSYHDGMDYTLPDRFDESGDMIRIPNEDPFDLTGLYVELGCAYGAPGETVTVPVFIAGADLGSIITFIDPLEGLELTDITTNAVEDFNLWFPQTEEQRLEGYNKEHGTDCFWTSYLPKGSIVIATDENINTQDGYVIAYYSYTIPEDTQPGTVYPICLNTAKSSFGSRAGNYQYTLLNGVVVVE